MKKSIAVILVLLIMMGSIAAVADSDAVTVTASSPGRYETVTVTLTVQNGKIIDVEAVSDNPEEAGGEISRSEALQRTTEAMIEKNSVNVDTITSATDTCNTVMAAAANAYLQLSGVDINLDAWASSNGYVKAEGYHIQAGTDAIASATVSGIGGINFGDIDLSDDLKKKLILDYLRGADNNYREMYQIATSYNNVPTVACVEFVLDPEDLSLFGSSEANTAKLNNMEINPHVDLYWTRQIRAGDVCSEAMPVLPTYFMSYGVELTGTYRKIVYTDLSAEEKPVFVKKARDYYATLPSTAQYAGMSNDELYEYLCGSTINFYQIVPGRIVVTSPWFLSAFDSGFARRFVSEELQEELLQAVKAQYPEAESLTAMNADGTTGLKTQQTLIFSEP
ncbi:MAG: FMN-binding protein [Clostridia bacterium]|nr:FMN-binding protein [Clostridia bacterium]